MTPLARVLRWLRGPWVAPDPAPDWWGPACTCTTHAALRARDALHATLRAEGTRYDSEWPDVIAAEAPGGDLAAMAAPLPGMARDDLGTYAEPVVVHIKADVRRFRDEMAHAARKAAELTAPVKPRGRHRQTDPLDLILADLRDLGGL